MIPLPSFIKSWLHSDYWMSHFLTLTGGVRAEEEGGETRLTQGLIKWGGGEWRLKLIQDELWRLSTHTSCRQKTQVPKFPTEFNLWPHSLTVDRKKCDSLRILYSIHTSPPGIYCIAPRQHLHLPSTSPPLSPEWLSSPLISNGGSSSSSFCEAGELRRRTAPLLWMSWMRISIAQIFTFRREEKRGRRVEDSYRYSLL